MKYIKQVGGISSLVAATTFIFGMVLFFTVLSEYGSGELNGVDKIGFMVENQTLLYMWNQVIYVVFGIVLVFLTLALYHRTKQANMLTAQIAAAFGLIWAGLVIASGMVFNIGLIVVANLYATDPMQAVTAWLPISIVQDGLGGGNEIVGGIWVLLVSICALQGSIFSKPLSYFGIIVGVAGIITLIPVLAMGGVVFGLGSILWFIWIGAAQLKNDTSVREEVDK